MKVYQINDADVDRLRSALEEDPSRNKALSAEEKAALETAHRFYMYRVVRWVQEVVGAEWPLR